MIVEKFRDNVGGWHAVVPVCLFKRTAAAEMTISRTISTIRIK